MSNNEAMDRSIRAKLLEANKVYGIVGKSRIMKNCWDEWDKALTNDDPDYHQGKGRDLLVEMIRSCAFTPDELRYGHENMPTEAWNKLGLKLPEKKLKYTIPTDLSPQVVEWLEASVEKGQCQRFEKKFAGGGYQLDCNMLCLGWVTSEWPGCSDHRAIKPKYLEMFKTILDAQLPPLNYTVPDLDAEERKHVEYATQCLEESCNGNCPACEPIMGKIFDASQCYLFSRPLGSPERDQTINALKDVLEQQKPLLPPHNVIQPPEEEFQQYVAVWVGFKRVEIVTVLEKRASNQVLTTLLDNGVQQVLHTSNLTPLTNPLECRDMLNKVLGEESMVKYKYVCGGCGLERIEAEYREKVGCTVCGVDARHLTYAGEVERKAKCSR